MQNWLKKGELRKVSVKWADDEVKIGEESLGSGPEVSPRFHAGTPS